MSVSGTSRFQMPTVLSPEAFPVTKVVPVSNVLPSVTVNPPPNQPNPIWHTLAIIVSTFSGIALAAGWISTNTNSQFQTVIKQVDVPPTTTVVTPSTIPTVIQTTPNTTTVVPATTPTVPPTVTPNPVPNTVPVTPTPAPLTLLDLEKVVATLTDVINQSHQKSVTPTPNTVPLTPIISHVTPQVPTATIVTSDAKGKALPVDPTNSAKTAVIAEPNKMFTVMSTGTSHANKATSLRWTVLKDAANVTNKPADEQIDTTALPDSDGNGTTAGYAVRMDANTTLTLVLAATQGDVVSTASLIVKCGQGAQPPPAVVVTPTIVPTIQPTPQPLTPVVNPPAVVGANDLRVIIIYEPQQNHSQSQLNVLNSTKLLRALNDGCVKDSTGPAWRRWSQNMDTRKDHDPKLRDLFATVLPASKQAGLPVMVIACGDNVTIKPISSTMKEDDAVALLKCGS